MNHYLCIAPVLSFVALAILGILHGNTAYCGVWICYAGLLFLPYGWVRIVSSTTLVLGMGVWITSGYDLIQTRLVSGTHWELLFLLFGTGTVLFCFAIYILVKGTLKNYYSHKYKMRIPLALIFMSIVTLLEVLRTFVPLDLLLVDRFVPNLGSLSVFFFALYGVLIGSKLLEPSNISPVRFQVWITFSIVFFLQLIIGLAGVKKMLMTGGLHLPIPALIVAGPLFRGSSFFMPILFLTTVFLIGPAWCSYLCYIGSWDHWFSTRAPTQKRSFHQISTLPKWTKTARVTILVLTIILPLVLRFFAIPIIWGLSIASLFGLGGIGIMLYFSKKMGIMVHCTVYCPIGLMGNILGKISLWRLKINSQCTQCMRCAQMCRYNALTKEDLLQKNPGLSCTLCGDCVSACKEGYLTYSFLTISSKRAQTTFIVLTVTIHVLFLAVARM